MQRWKHSDRRIEFKQQFIPIRIQAVVKKGVRSQSQVISQRGEGIRRGEARGGGPKTGGGCPGGLSRVGGPKGRNGSNTGKHKAQENTGTTDNDELAKDKGNRGVYIQDGGGETKRDTGETNQNKRGNRK